ncbi:MAG: nitrate oxidoreductase subunit beta [Planctomycetota bacterium]|nr:nitrate oxidoreductase subunit beta [Planctomycetota bacterium]
MPKVQNWQLGREMDYPFEQAAPSRQFAFVININRCLGCQTCTMACKSTWTFSKGQEYMWWTNVESKPYGGYPQWWDVKLLQKLAEADPQNPGWEGEPEPGANSTRPYGTYGGQTIFEAAKISNEPGQVLGHLPTDDEWRHPNIYEDTPPQSGQPAPGQFDQEGAQLPEHKTWFFYLARLCNHCSYPGCLAACPRKAIYKRPEDGIVLIDQEECRGYRKCVEACPYKKSMYRATTRVSEKCIACYPRIEGTDPQAEGVPLETRCMSACIGQIRLQGLVELNADGSWKHDPSNPLYYMVKVAKVALPLYPQFGTQPNGFYIPPRWAPRPYLRQMFGPGVDEAISKYRTPDRELLGVLQLFRRSNKIIFKYKLEKGPKVYEREVNGKQFELYDDTVIAYGKEGQELFRTKVEEPVVVRPEQYANSI